MRADEEVPDADRSVLRHARVAVLRAVFVGVAAACAVAIFAEPSFGMSIGSYAVAAFLTCCVIEGPASLVERAMLPGQGLWSRTALMGAAVGLWASLSACLLPVQIAYFDQLVKTHSIEGSLGRSVEMLPSLSTTAGVFFIMLVSALGFAYALRTVCRLRGLRGWKQTVLLLIASPIFIAMFGVILRRFMVMPEGGFGSNDPLWFFIAELYPKLLVVCILSPLPLYLAERLTERSPSPDRSEVPST
jgi:hypothetical protein